ncbi:ion transporter [Tenacibaculum sp. HL-MS23]|uniref:ion transporter n=1 Tax=Tenacibaculum TaxID=104267 RepID=UPI001C4EB5AF|nr:MULTISPECIES: ion transporter [Tenacibaculum]QXP73633.1 ion transporter [Tenacibaculum sp. AHE14PA]QXP75998.1 ion transporter [Tenacibaculum sp. AHE15PA]WNW02565.1 ion transporter [Tenacibaculum sp. HL-MS23]
MENKTKNWKDKLHDVIYGTDTPAGKLFDIVLLFAILISILLVMLESIESFDNKYHDFLNTAEWVITFLFTIEYFARIISIKKPSKYIFSFYGVVDFLSTIPKYLSLFLIGSHSLVALRAFRLLRIFRILKVSRYVGESNQLIKSLNASKAKIGVFLYFVLIVCIILGAVMYFIEGAENGFTSIPRSIYWSIVTLTTVGYGDIAPQTALGQLIASITVIIGYAIIAIPTGIVSSEMARKQALSDSKKCPDCSTTGHKDDAEFCYNCGTKLN